MAERERERVREHLAGQVCGPGSRFLDPLQIVSRRGIRGNLHPGQFRVADNGGEDVVEVVGDTAGQHSQAFQLLGFQHPALVFPAFVFGFFPVGNVADADDQTTVRPAPHAADADVRHQRGSASGRWRPAASR